MAFWVKMEVTHKRQSSRKNWHQTNDGHRTGRYTDQSSNGCDYSGHLENIFEFPQVRTILQAILSCRARCTSWIYSWPFGIPRRSVLYSKSALVRLVRIFRRCIYTVGPKLTLTSIFCVAILPKTTRIILELRLKFGWFGAYIHIPMFTSWLSILGV